MKLGKRKRAATANGQGSHAKVIESQKQILVVISAIALTLLMPSRIKAQETVGGGTSSSPAVAPLQSYNVGGPGFVPVKNWHFGTNGTIKNITDMNTNFMYHDQFGTIIGGGTKYGAKTVAPDAANALSGQPIEDSANPVRTFQSDSLKTYLVPLNGATTVSAVSHNAGCGSFAAKWTLPNGGSLLNQDILWETKVRYVTPPYFWFAIWSSGNQWDHGAENDIVESFGYDNGGGYTNYDGRYWHSDSVGGTNTTSYSNWNNGMTSRGITSFDATQWHTWTWLYRRDNTYVHYVDGIPVQSGTMNWTKSGLAGGTPINMSFLFDATWGSEAVSSVNHSLAASQLVGKYYEWAYSRVYLRNAPSLSAPANLTATAGPSQVSLSWNAVSGATSYNVYRGTSAGGESITPIASGITGTSYVNTGLTNGTTYYYYVDAVNSSGRSAPSNEVNAAPQVTTYTLSPIADSYIRGLYYASTNYGTATTLAVKLAATDDYMRKTYFKYDLSGVGGTVSSATLRCYGSLSTTDTVTIGAYPVADTSWTETGITWNNAPAIGTPALATKSVTNTAGQYLSWDVSSYIGSHLGGPVSMAVQSPAQSTWGAVFTGNSREAASNPPQLVIVAY